MIHLSFPELTLFWAQLMTSGPLLAQSALRTQTLLHEEVDVCAADNHTVHHILTHLSDQHNCYRTLEKTALKLIPSKCLVGGTVLPANSPAFSRLGVLTSSLSIVDQKLLEHISVGSLGKTHSGQRSLTSHSSHSTLYLRNTWKQCH